MACTTLTRPLQLTQRLRRLRRSETMRALVRETRLSPDQLIYPMFVCEGVGEGREERRRSGGPAVRPAEVEGCRRFGGVGSQRAGPADHTRARARGARAA